MGIGPVTPVRAGDPYGVMQRDQNAGQQGGHRQFNPHQPVQPVRGQHHHRAKAQLHQPWAHDLEPVQHHIPRKAKAAIIMPDT